MRSLYDTLMGLVRLGWLVVRARGGARGAYWRWREATAFGAGAPGRAGRARAIREYARWVHRMSRLG
ncbi:MAG: hypothetical protein IT439_10135 [Phycisphaerales bacterium]|nr:hypothetical protein [Phycisphaerales bacterium]